MKEDYELFEKFIISKYDINNIHNHYKLIKLMKNNVVYLENKYNERVLRNKYNITIQCLDSNLLINIINYFNNEIKHIINLAQINKEYNTQIKYLILNSNSIILNNYNEKLLKHIYNSYYTINDLKNFNNSLYIKHTEIPLANEIKNGLDTHNNLLIHNTIKIYNYFFSYNEAYTLYFCSNKNKKNICDFYNKLFKINLKNANINSKYNELKIFENIYNIYNYVEHFFNFKYNETYKLFNIDNNTIIPSNKSKEHLSFIISKHNCNKHVTFTYNKLRVFKYEYDLYVVIGLCKTKNYNELIKYINKIKLKLNYIQYNDHSKLYNNLVTLANLSNTNSGGIITKTILIIIYTKYYLKYLNKNINATFINNASNILLDYYENLKVIKPYYLNKYITSEFVDIFKKIQEII